MHRGTCPVMLKRGYRNAAGEFEPYVFCSAPPADGKSYHLCTAHEEIAARAGRNFARTGKLYHSQFTRLDWHGYGGRMLLDVFARSLREALAKVGA